MVILWGRDLVQIYNHSYAHLLGQRHPKGMGQPAKECWPEAWDLNQPIYEAVLRRGKDIYFQNAHFSIERGRGIEEAYFSISYSPLRDDNAVIRGVLVAVNETTRMILDQRRLRTLSLLAMRIGKSRTALEVGEGLAEVLRENSDDVTFAALYGETRKSRSEIIWNPPLLAHVGAPAAPASLLVNPWYNHQLSHSGFIDLSPHDRGGQVYISNLGRLGDGTSLGCLIIGCNPLVRVDDEYREYIEMMAAYITMALENVEAFQRESRIADTLQRAAMPLEIEAVPGVKIDRIYEAANDEARIGGDWYDAFTLSDGRLVLSIGDVCGNGVKAATVMGGVRQMIRALAQVSKNPAFILNAVEIKSKEFGLARRPAAYLRKRVLGERANDDVAILVVART